MTARERRWRFGKKDRGPGRDGGRPDGKEGAREVKKRAGKLKTRPETKMTVRMAKPRAGTLKKGPGTKSGCPDGKNWGGQPRKSGRAGAGQQVCLVLVVLAVLWVLAHRLR